MIKNIKAYINHTTPWMLLVITAYAIAFVYLFTENFIFSQNSALLSFRSVDDQWFQAYIRDIHESLQWYGLNHYNYGWIYWFPMAVLMYPFYLLSIHTGIDMPLLALPRQISLMFVMATAVVLYKIAAKYSQDKFLIAIALLLYLSYPATGFISLRFGTVGQNMFFSALAFYLAIISSKARKKSLFLVAFVFAIAVATKITALLIAPLIFLILADKFEWNINRENIITALQLLAVFLLSFLYLAQINILVFISNIKVLMFPLSSETPGELFTRGIATYTLTPVFFILALLGLLVKPIIESSKHKKIHRDFIYIFLSLAIACIYLTQTIKGGSLFVCLYFAIISFLLPLGVLCLEYLGNKSKYIIGIGFLTISLITNFHNIMGTENDWNRVSWNLFYNKAKNTEIAKKILTQKNLQAMVNSFHSYPKTLNLIRDFNTVSIYSPLSTNISIQEHIVNERWSTALARIKDIEYWQIIGLDKNNDYFLNDKEFAEIMQNSTVEMNLWHQDNRTLIREFLKTKSLNGHAYKILFEDEYFAYFIEENALS